MDKSSKLTLTFGIAMLVTLIGVALIMIPHLNNWLTWTGEIILIFWIILLSTFVIKFRKFEKEKGK